MKVNRAILALLCVACSCPAAAAAQNVVRDNRIDASARAPAADLNAIERAIAGGRLTQARLMLSNLTLESAKGPRFDLLLGRYYLAQGQDVLALERFERALAEEGGSALTGAGIASLRLGHHARAQTYLKAAVAKDPQDGQAWNALGTIADRLQDWDASETAYARALEIRPQDPMVLNNLGYSLLLRQYFQDAVLLLGRAAAAAPAEPVIQNNYALALALTGQYPSDSVQSEPQDEQARHLNNAGYAAWLNGDVAAARSLFSRAIEAKPSHYGLAERNLAMVEKGLAQ